MRINQKLNLIVPLERDGATIYVHVTPLHREVFERYFLVLSQTFNAIYSAGVGLIGAPRVAALMLKQQAIESGSWEGEAGVEMGLMREINRLSNMIVLTPEGWQAIPMYDALKQDFLDEDDKSEVEGQVVFFIVASAMHKRSELPGILAFTGKYWSAQTSVLNSTEFANSLPILTTEDVTAAKETASSIPS